MTQGKVWEILSPANLSLGKKSGHISHSAYCLGRPSEFLRRVQLKGPLPVTRAQLPCPGRLAGTGWTDLPPEERTAGCQLSLTVELINLVSSDGQPHALDCRGQTRPLKADLILPTWTPPPISPSACLCTK